MATACPAEPASSWAAGPTETAMAMAAVTPARRKRQFERMTDFLSKAW
jgi:hypothetical protein